MEKEVLGSFRVKQKEYSDEKENWKVEINELMK